ncbi:DNA cytosine methyltransferase [Clostridium intestinale]|uniref:DNA (cytosine-5-)-methyltransferase n=1 Tax=Clostridium intestinale TaxID=36845 RepID=A0A7D6VSV2_9CLOT|nr:DNA cytosine methyltransferase [Clostridium intestinale]QLY81249.1 DNA cytosine methyltransferase [Clostridium intestinale]
MYTCIDCFSGAGGLSIGLAKSGIDVIYGFDIDEKCIETQRKNKRYIDHQVGVHDIKDMLNGNLLDMLKIRKGELFLLAGGPPCQGFSVQRIGSDIDERNDLVLYYLRLIEEVYPKFFVMENVSGITGKRGKSYFDKFLSDIKSIGYTVTYDCLDMQNFGVPQRRKRMIAVGVRNDICKAPFILPLSEGSRKVTVRDTIGSIPAPPEDYTDHPDYIHHRRDKLSAKNMQRILMLREGQGRDYLPDYLLADCHKKESAIIGHRNVYGRMKWDDVAPTITARFDSFTRGQFGHPDQPRSISLREGALLQKFPIDFVFSGNKVDIARQIGNAVPPLFSSKLGKWIIEYYESECK